MKKSRLFIILILFTGVAMYTVDYFSSLPPSEEVELGGIVQEPKVVRDFKAFCDTLSESKWEPNAFQARVDRLNVYRAQSIVNTSEFLNLEQYMYSAYASSMVNSFEQWKQGCDISILGNLNNEMKRIRNKNIASQNKLDDPLKEIKDFYFLRSIPGKLKNQLENGYDEADFNKLYSRIDSSPNYFRSCSNVNTIKNDALDALNQFQDFAINYRDAKSIYQRSQDNFTIRDLKKLCQNARLNNYVYYITKLNELDVCN